MASKKQQKQMANLVGLGIGVAAVIALMRKKDRSTIDGWGATPPSMMVSQTKRYYSRKPTIEETVALMVSLLAAEEAVSEGADHFYEAWQPLPYTFFSPYEQEAFTSTIDPWGDEPGLHRFTVYSKLRERGVIGAAPNENYSFARIVSGMTPGWDARRQAAYAIKGEHTRAREAWMAHPYVTAPAYVFEGEQTKNKGTRRYADYLKSGSFDGYGASGTHAAQWYPSRQRQSGPGFRVHTPLGPVFEHAGKYCSHAHPGLSHVQWTQLVLRDYYGVDPRVYPSVVPALIGSDPLAVSETGFFSGYGAMAR